MFPPAAEREREVAASGPLISAPQESPSVTRTLQTPPTLLLNPTPWWRGGGGWGTRGWREDRGCDGCFREAGNTAERKRERVREREKKVEIVQDGGRGVRNGQGRGGASHLPPKLEVGWRPSVEGGGSAHQQTNGCATLPHAIICQIPPPNTLLRIPRHQSLVAPPPSRHRRSIILPRQGTKTLQVTASLS